MSTAKPLDGIVITSVEHAVAVPYAARLLADLGARVIKIERPGDGDFARHYDRSCGAVSSYFAWVNVGKESITLDLKAERGIEVARRLVARSDVVLCNLSPGAARRLGLDADTLRATRPALIVGELSSYGADGPYASRKAFDALVQSEAGLISLTGDGAVQGRAGISVADIAGGTQLHAAVLAALLHRARTGEGATVRLSLLEALAEWMHQPLLLAVGTGTAPPRTGAHHASIAPYGPFRCGDGGFVHLAVQNEPQFARLCALVGDAGLARDPRFASNPARVAHRAEPHAVLDAAFAGFTAAGLLDALDAADVPAGRTRDLFEVAGHPQLAARDRWTDVPVPATPVAGASTAGGADAGTPAAGSTDTHAPAAGPTDADAPASVRMLRPPVDSTAWTWDAAPVPALGEHTDAVLDWLGYSPGDVTELRASGVV